MAKILILGGYGVFGGRLARRLVAETDAEVVVAGRSLAKAKAFCRQHGGKPFMLDRDGDVSGAFASLLPDIVVDAAGPFQAYGDDAYRVARAAIACGAHYLDLADDTAFVAGVSALDAEACEVGVCVLSGASSVPSISSAALDELTRGLESVALVASAILPGNRAPRGLSVVRSIVGQVGQPLRMWRGGRWTERPAWGGVEHLDLLIDGVPPLNGRLASPIGAPDLELFPQRYGARSVLFEAGLDLKLMHLGLWLLAGLVRIRVLSSLLGLAKPLKWMADRLERFGSDRGGMIVRAVGRNAGGDTVERTWTLIAEGGDGPEIPATPALLICKRLLAEDADGMITAPSLPEGAYPAVGVLRLDEIEAGLSPFAIRFGRAERMTPPLLERALGADAATMPMAWRRLGAIHDLDHFAGEASVTRGDTALARWVGAAFGFPPAAASVPVEVTKQKTAQGETWTRRFGDHAFRSRLSRRPDDARGVIRERFGPFSFTIRLEVKEGRVVWPVVAWRCLGIPMPAFLAPRSESIEYVDEQGRFCFDVALSAPLAGLIVRYRGWLSPV